MNKDAFVDEYYGEMDGQPKWEVSFRRNLKDFDEEQYMSIKRLSGETHICLEVEDKWILVKALLKVVYANQNQMLPYNQAWNNKIPPKIQVFTWTTIKGKISVKYILKERGLLPKRTLEACVLCGLEWESVDHLMCRCQFSMSIWCMFLNLMGCERVFNRDVEKIISEWWGTPFTRRRRVHAG